MQLTNPTYVKSDDQTTYAASQVCTSGCGRTTTVTITPEQLWARNNGAAVQVAFPNLSPAEREAVFMTGMCPTCYNALWSFED